MQEHRVIERVITSLEQGADRLEQGKAIEPAFFIDAAQFIKGFADGCHHMKEEGVHEKYLGLANQLEKAVA
jgi:hemerythrin-like domain-containing protein